MKPFVEQKLTIKDNDYILDEYNNPVMMVWEKEWMYESAKVICENGGDILNIGFGLGIIDNFIQSYNIKSHTIIEPHPQIIDKMKSDGWNDKANVTVIPSKWQEVIDTLPKYDGIYFDAYQIVSKADTGGLKFLELFIPHLKKILKTDGVFSFWPGPIFTSNRGPLIQFRNNLISALQQDFVVEKITHTYKQQDSYRENLKYKLDKEFIVPKITYRKTPLIKPLL